VIPEKNNPLQLQKLKELRGEEDAEGLDDQILGKDKQDASLYTEDAFQRKIEAHAPNVLECLFLPHDKILLEKKTFQFTLNLGTLRSSFSKLVPFTSFFLPVNRNQIRCRFCSISSEFDFDKTNPFTLNTSQISCM
jgi:hypothetical protein